MSSSKEKSKVFFLNRSIQKLKENRNSNRTKKTFYNSDGGTFLVRVKALFNKAKTELKKLSNNVRSINLKRNFKGKKEPSEETLKRIEEKKLERERCLKQKKLIRERAEKEKKIEQERAEKEAIEKAQRKARELHEKRQKRMLKFPFGKIKICVQTENSSRLFSALKKEGVIFPKTAENGKVTFLCYAKHSSKIIALLERLCYNYQIIGNIGVLPALTNALMRVGVVVGALFFIAAATVYPKFVIKIVPDGTLNSDAKAILNEYGVVEGAFLPSIDTAAIEDRLLELDGVSFASVVRRGTRVYVTLREELDKEYFLSLKGDRVVASKDCVITRVIVYDGTAVVQKGDVIKAGQTLIEPYLLVREEQIPSRAGGEVYGTVTQTKTMFYPYAELCTEEGKSKSISKLSLFEGAPKMPKSPYENYRVSLTVTTNDFMVPYKIYRWTFTELKAVERINKLTDAEMRRKTMSILVSQLPANATLLSYTTESVANELGVTVTATATVEERVG